MEAASKLMANLVKNSVFASEVTRKEREVKSQKRCLMWKRFVTILFLVEIHATSGSLLNHLTLIHERKEEEAKLRLKILARQTADTKPKSEKKKYVRPDNMPLCKGPLMTRSEEKVWRLEPEDCSHPPSELSNPRSAGTKKWFTCLACGTRWERVHAEVQEILVQTENNPADKVTKMPAWKEKKFEEWLEQQNRQSQATSSSSASPTPEALSIVAAPEARKRTTTDQDDSAMTIVLTPMAEAMRKRYLDLVSPHEGNLTHDQAVMWMLSNVPQSEPQAVKALQELLQYLAHDA